MEYSDILYTFPPTLRILFLLFTKTVSSASDDFFVKELCLETEEGSKADHRVEAEDF